MCQTGRPGSIAIDVVRSNASARDLLFESFEGNTRVSRSNVCHLAGPRPRRDATIPSTLGSVLAVLFIWTLLASFARLEPLLGTSRTLLVSFLAATAWLLATRSFRGDRRRAHSIPLLLVGLLAGFASYPAWIATIGALGMELGLRPAVSVAPGSGEPLFWTAAVLLAPVFEEVLYRERLLTALTRTLGSSLAIPISSAVFAISHLEPWRVLGTGLVGLMLGTAMHASRSLALCVGLHMGLNLAGLTSGVPPVRVSLAPSESAAVGFCVLGVAIVLARKW